MDVHKNIELLADAQEAVLVARSKADGDGFVVRSLRMDRDKYLDLHKVNPSDISKTIDALVAGLEKAQEATLMEDVFPHEQIDAALALARKGG